MLVWIATELLNTADNMDTPCSVNAKGIYRIPPLFEVTDCDLKLIFNTLYSDSVISNIKSEGNLSLLRRTACFYTFVGTW